MYALSSIISAVLNAERDYVWSTAAPILNNIVTMASFIAYALLSSSNQQLAILILALEGHILGFCANGRPDSSLTQTWDTPDPTYQFS